MNKKERTWDLPSLCPQAGKGAFSTLRAGDQRRGRREGYGRLESVYFSISQIKWGPHGNLINSNSNYGILTHGAPPNDSEGRGGMGGEGGSLAGSACIFAAGPNSAAGVAPPVAGRKIRLIIITLYSLRRTFLIKR